MQLRTSFQRTRHGSSLRTVNIGAEEHWNSFLGKEMRSLSWGPILGAQGIHGKLLGGGLCRTLQTFIAPWHNYVWFWRCHGKPSAVHVQLCNAGCS
jgi:hypothetical protein